MRLFFVLFLTAVITVQAQPPQVPHKMQFAGMTLTIRDDARREIQKDVNALTQSPRHHNIKVERAKTYFPIIEKVFEEERIPDDFKYLVLQESALIADAVSVSNAVGFWQFKDYTAVEMGLRVDKEIDERLNIVSSSRAAARYIKKNNFYFNNWIFALQAYQMGAGGAMKSVPKNLSGAKNMEITSSTYWYVKKYLAHKIAFEDAVKGEGQIKAIAYQNNSKKMLAEIAKEVSISEDELKQYNKWAKAGRIPDDRTYTVIIPRVGDGPEIKLPETVVASTTAEPVAKDPFVRPDRTKINGIKVIKALPGETAVSIASRAGVPISDFLNWNDIPRSARIETDQYYLLGKKRARAQEAYHKVEPGENLWAVSQKYGVQLKKLRRYNRLNSNEDIQPGTTLWLAAKKPRNSNSEATTPAEVIEVDKEGATFAWGAESSSGETSVSSQPTVSSNETTVPVITPASVAEPVMQENSDEKPLDSIQTLQPVKAVTMLPDSALQKSETIVIAESKKKEHVVQAKETLYGIAHTYNIGVMDLVRWNNLNLQDGIRPGQVLKLSENSVEDENLAFTSTLEHEVKTTDTLYSIARKYGVTIKDLMEWNNKKDFSLAIGEKLKIQGR
jgi:membrane-bound lytic murein transglycosylase D